MQTSTVQQTTILRKQFTLKRPDWFVSKIIQLVIFVRDVSTSMRGSKGKEAEEATEALVAEISSQQNNGMFLVSIVDFSDSARLVHDPTPANQLAGHIKPMRIGGGTNVTSGLEIALSTLKSQGNIVEANVKRLKPVVITTSDGGHNIGPASELIDIAGSVKAIADHVTVGFGDDSDDKMLKTLATSPQHFYKIRESGKELRMFLAAVGQTLTSTMAQGMNATVALTQVQR
ncbi:MAG: hypothetical protein A2283_13990 [Lentisphaerae bacterium RIFOXYA12_FULL_48_11]|nr:MAG: hypothetical protein A2283_13990 [Lentisphaerae bacterium RIFOXYA12_FULL_48_11]